MMLFRNGHKKFLLKPRFEDLLCFLGVIREGIRYLQAWYM